MLRTWLLSLIRFALSLRYRIHVVGLEELKNELPEGPGGILFLPNHSTVMIDPAIATTEIMRVFPVRPVIVDFMYYLPGVYTLMNLIRAVSIPNFSVSSNSHKVRRMDLALEEVERGLERGENFVFYPAGKVKLSAKEQIGGSSGLNKILSEATHYKVVLVRITGLWGSRFSRAFPKEPMGKTLLWGIKRTLKNLLFFNPRRDVTIEFVPAPEDFPYKEQRRVQNQYLEDWYNDMGNGEGESLKLVPYSAWSKRKPELGPLVHKEEREIDLAAIPKDVKHKVLMEISKLVDRPPSQILPEMMLATDLGIDSLDASEITLFLEEEFDAKDVPAEELTSVAKVLGIAAHHVQYEPEEEELIDRAKWDEPYEKERILLGEGQNLAEIFFKICKKRKGRAAVVDNTSGVLTYSDLLMRVILLANYIKELPGNRIGILLPSSVAAYVVVFATLVAKKVPVMINWTVGSRHINSVLETSKIDLAISSWSFLDRLPNVELGSLVDKLVQLEDVRHQLRLKDKLKALWLSKKSAHALIQHFDLQKIKPSDPAVILYTSGSEGAPKGVPLSHRNIISDIHSVIQVVPLYSDDTFFSILPPFHSFGFTVCGVTPILLGVKAAFFPNPTEGAKIASGIKRWGATIVFGAPSFYKKIFRGGSKEKFASLRMTVSGAERAPPEMFSMAKELGLGQTVIEGYGITECSPVITLNHPGEEVVGVGRAIPHVELLIVDPDTHQPLPTGERGLILVRGPIVFSGYLNGAKHPFLTLEDKQWYVTGDLGTLDHNQQLTISGRLKRFIKVGPEMISLEAVESALMEGGRDLNWPSTDEGPILGLVAKELSGEKPKMFLFTTFPLSAEEGNRLLKESGFSNLVRLTDTFQLAEIPLMGTGKVNYRKLEEEFMR